MKFNLAYDLGREGCERLLAKGTYFNFLGQYNEDTKYCPLDTFTTEDAVMVCITQDKMMKMLDFVKELQRHGLYERFYQLGKNQLAQVTGKTVNFPKEAQEAPGPSVKEAKQDFMGQIKAFDVDSAVVAEEVKQPATSIEYKAQSARHSMKFICDIRVILHSSLTAIAEFCALNDLYLDINDGVHMSFYKEEQV